MNNRNRITTHKGWWIAGGCIAVALYVGIGASLIDDAFASSGDPLTYKPHMIIQNESEQCAQCHQLAVDAWAESTHKKTWDELHLRPEAEAIVRAMGGRSIRRDDECVRCHYTMVSSTEGGRTSAVMGISCQRCHGEAKDWMDPHADRDKYPDKTERLRVAESFGMRPTYDIYQLAASCYECHTVPREDLVNVGGHPAGSDFELVAWSQGEVRHNFLPVPEERPRENRKPSDDQLRLWFVIGKVLDLEYSLRALAEATDPEGKFAMAMTERVANAKQGVSDLNVSGLNGITGAVPADPGSAGKDALLAAANAIRDIAQGLEASQPNLSNISLPDPSTYRGSVSSF